MTPPRKTTAKKPTAPSPEDLEVEAEEEQARVDAEQERIEAAKASVKTAAPPAKRAERLKAHPELADKAWVAGNPDAAAALGG